MMHPRYPRAAWAVLLAVLLSGCHAENEAHLRSIRGLYETGQFAAAYNEAVVLATYSENPVHDQALHLAGLSAERLGDREEAIRLLKTAASSPVQPVATNAAASLGLIYARIGIHDRAADLLLEAAPHLQGQSRANAYFHAGASQQRLGRWGQARVSLLTARRRSSDPQFVRQVDRQLAVTGFTLQLGAFEQESNAQALASQVAKDARSLSQGPPQVVLGQQPDGRRWYLVQVGRYLSHATAAAARDQLSPHTAVIVPLTTGPAAEG